MYSLRYARKFLGMLALCLLLSMGLLGLPAVNAASDGDDDDYAPEASKIQYKLAVRSFVSWWSHDATGYHPTVLIQVENVSGRDLSGIPMKFQVRFQDLRNGFVTVARKETRFDAMFVDMAPKYLMLKGPRAFELPIDTELWPTIEFKVMCRVGDVSDAGTQTLLVSRLDSVTMTDEDSMSRLSKQARFDRPAASAPPRPAVPSKPLSATAGSLNPPNTNGTASPSRHGQPGKKASLSQFMSNGGLPGLGDDFYVFEKTFGRPVQTETKDKNWIWAIYRKSMPALNVVVGSHGRSGKADIIVITIPQEQVQGESQLVSLARSMSGPFKGEQPSQPNHSVRYLANGRLEVSTMAARSYRASVMTPEMPNLENCFVLAITRLPGNLQRLLSTESQRREVLRFLAPMLKDEAESDG